MLSHELQNASFSAARDFAMSHANEDYFNEKCTVYVNQNGENIIYNHITVTISYQTAYEDFRVTLVWEEDEEQISYKDIGLHGYYSTNFNLFVFNELSETLSFNDEDKTITIIA